MKTGLYVFSKADQISNIASYSLISVAQSIISKNAILNLPL